MSSIPLHVRRIIASTTYTGISTFLYFREIEGPVSTEHALLVVAVALFVSMGIYFLLPLARKVKKGSTAYKLVWVATIGLWALGIIGEIESTKAWSWPVLFFAIWLPVIFHIGQHVEDRMRFKKAPHSM